MTNGGKCKLANLRLMQISVNDCISVVVLLSTLWLFLDSGHGIFDAKVLTYSVYRGVYQCCNYHHVTFTIEDEMYA